MSFDKGGRHARLSVRVPEAVRKYLMFRAVTDGITLSDVVVALLTDACETQGPLLRLDDRPGNG